MKDRPIIEVRIGRGAFIALTLLVVFAVTFLLLPERLQAQKAQETFKDKFKIASDNGGIGVAVSADGKYVYVVGPGGILVSDDFGKTGSWVQTAQLK